MTEQEKNIIKNEIMDALLYGSKTIDQLTLSSDISDADLFEISGGRAITYSTLKAAIAASITNGGGSGSGHTHANKDSLDQIATDSDGYIHLTYPKRVLNEATKEYETIITTEKVKAGYADKAGDLSDDSPVLKLINTIGNQFVPTYLDGSTYVDTTWAEIVAGTRTLAAIKSVKGFFSDSFISARGANSAGGGSTGGAYYLSDLLDTAIDSPASGQALVYNGSKWVNGSAGLNESQLASYLSTNNYAKKSDLPDLTLYLTKTAAAAIYVTQEEGKGLTANDFTDALKTKLDGIEAGANKYILPAASASTLGGVKVGSTLAMTNGVLDQKAGIVSGGVYPKVTVDTYGRVTAGELLAASDIPNLPWSKITSGTPTTIAGYGITDTYTKTDADNRFVQQSLFDSMFAKESDGNGGFRIKAKYGLYSDSFISARGVNPDGGGSGGGGVYYLHELLDAAINNPATGQALVYNGTKWVNQAIQTGLDEVALASYLTTHSYATQSWVENKGYLTSHQSLANYVTLNTPQNITANKAFYGEEKFIAGGGTYTDPWSGIACAIKVTGKVGITDSIKAASFIKANGTASQFLMADGNVATKHVLTASNNLGWDGTQGQIPTIDTLAFWNGRYNATNSNLQYCDRGRFGTMAVANAADYLARAGGSMLNTSLVTNLNADLLDGKHSYAFANRCNLDYTTGTSVGDFCKANADTRNAGNILSASGWAWANSRTLKLNDSYSIDNQRYSCITYRNGDLNGTWQQQALLFLPTYSDSNMIYLAQMVVEGTAGSVKTSIKRYADYDTVLASNVASATKLADNTAVKAWGQVFFENGKPKGVSGNMTGVGSITRSNASAVDTDAYGNLKFKSASATTWHIDNMSGAALFAFLSSGNAGIGTATPAYKLDVNGTARVSSLIIGDITLSYDAANGGLHVSGGGLYADTYLSARGANTSGSGSAGGGLIQQVYGSSSLGGAFSDTTLTDTFNAYTINKIRTDLINADSALSGRITSLEGGAAVSVTTTGSGNAITAISKSGTTITATKGATYLTAHQSLANYVTLNTTQTITGAKSFNGTLTINTQTILTGAAISMGSSIGNATYDKYHRIDFGFHSYDRINIYEKAVNFFTNGGTTAHTVITNTGLTAPKFIKSGGTASQILMADGSVKALSDITSAYVTALGTSGDYLTWVKNGATKNITVPYATTAAQLTGSAEHTGTALTDFDNAHTYTCQATNDLGDGISYSAILTVSGGSQHRFFQIIGGKGNPSYLRWRTTDANGAALGAVHRLLDDANYSSVLDSRYYTESEINAKLTNGSVTKVGTTTVGSTAKGIYLNGGTPTALSATVGAANRPVYMNAGTITAGTYTFGNGSGNAPISNGTLCTNLNADLLDGLHNGALTAKYLNLGAFADDWNAVPHFNGIYSLGVTNSPGSTYGVMLQWSNQNNPTPGTDQHWITQLASATSNRLFYRTRINTGAWSGWSALAFTSDNVASATKLQTARSLWGQIFNGTANVDGALTVHHTGACGVYISGGGESSYSCQASGGLRWVLGGYPDRFFIWDSSGNGNERLSILNNGSVGIGTTSPSAKLDVIGVIHSTAGMWSNGYVSARGQNTASDSRLKAILQTKLLDTRSIAAAPSVLFMWKDTGCEDVGSIAQYWQRIDRHLVSHRPDGYLGLDYGKAALLSVISVAKQTLNHEARIKALEKENARLKEQIKSLT